LEKVQRVLPVTCRLLGDTFNAVTRGFAAECAPQSYVTLDVAEQFAAFVAAKRADYANLPRFIQDAMAVELALARVIRPEEEYAYLGKQIAVAASVPFTVVARFEVIRCAHDVRPLFDPTVGRRPVKPRHILLVVLNSGRDGRRRVIEVSAPLFAFLSRLNVADEVPVGDAVLVSASAELGILDAVK